MSFTVTQPSPDTTPANLRRMEIVDTLVRKHPESRELLNELDNLINALRVESQEQAIRHQGALIMAAICGDLNAWPGCEPVWDGAPSDTDYLEVAS